MNIQRMVVGIDVSKDDFNVCFKLSDTSGKILIKGTHKFSNDLKGFEQLLEWTGKRNKNECELIYVMEATGVYYENLAHFLYSHNQSVIVVLANTLNSYAKSLNIKTKTDKVDAKTIAEYGLERGIDRWEPMSKFYKEMRDLCRELLSLKKDLSRAKSQLHAMDHSFEKSARVVKLKGQQIKFFQEAIKEINSHLEELVNQDSDFKARLQKVITIPGIAFETAIVLICETNGFRLFENIKQVVSYAGLDIKLNESGHFKGKTRISKKGNSRIRQVLYMPALCATQYNEPIKNLYQRVCEKNPTIKKKGVVAAMRKLLILSYVIWSKNEAYDKAYKWRA